DGADVFTWNVLKEVKNEHYRPGDWNALKVRFEKGRIQCFINDEPAIESNDGRLDSGKVGLAKFRDTEAQFRSFRIGKELPSLRPADDDLARLKRLVDEVPADKVPDLADRFASEGALGVALLRERANVMEQQARQLKKLAQAVHHRRVEND